jgi:hypothetical protein
VLGIFSNDAALCALPVGILQRGAKVGQGEPGERFFQGDDD